MAIKLAGALLERDVKKESSKLGAQAAKLAKAKSGGAGIGGLLGSIAGIALAPFTGGTSLLLLGAVGGGLGALVGSKIGGASAGGQESIMGGKFLQGSRHTMATDIAQKEGMDVLMAAATGAFQAGNIAKGVGTFKSGAAAAKEAGKGFLGQIGQGGFDVVSAMAKSKFKGLGKDAVEGGAEDAVGDVVGGVADVAVPSFSGGDGGSGLLGAIPDMTEGMGGALNKLFPGMDEEGAAASMGMSLDEFYQYLQQASGSGVGS